jgi:uncharacterized RDD family membrane protein YckC
VNDTQPAGDATDIRPQRVASLKRRFGALLVDWVLCLLIAGWFGRVHSPWVPWAVLIGEYTFFLGLFGQTPGMWTARIRCASTSHGGPIGLPRAALRAVLLALVVPTLIMDEHNRGWHDRAAGSVMLAVD